MWLINVLSAFIYEVFRISVVVNSQTFSKQALETLKLSHELMVENKWM